jgi:hypothetical protein
MRKPYGYIYKTTNLLNNKIYIGKKANPVEVKNYYGSGKFLTIAIKKHGRDKFIREILCWKYSLNTLDKAEIFYIDYFDSTNPKIGYNVLPGGEGNPKGVKFLSEESKLKISIANKGRKLSDKHKLAISLAHKGKKLSEATKKKMRESKKEIPCSEETKLKISLGNKGKIRSEEAKKRYSLAKQNMSEETKKKMKLYQQNRPREMNIKIGLGNKGKKLSEETKKKMSEAHINLIRTKEHCKNISKGKKGIPWSQANRDAFNKRFNKNTKNS